MTLKCPIDNSTTPVLIRRGIWDDDKRNIYQCRKCRVVFLHPMRGEKEAQEFYKREGLQARLKRIPAKDKLKFLRRKHVVSARRQFRLLKRYLKPAFSLCEIGASEGYFLEEARKKVARVFAVEPGSKEAKILSAKGIERAGWIDDLENLPRKFDAVAMFHLFEHLSAPLSFLRKLKKCLKKRALVFVEVPNVDDVLLSRYQLENFKRFYFQSMHCFYYNEKTLAGVFKRAGFDLVDCQHIQRYPFSNHLQWLLCGTAGGNKEYKAKFDRIDKAYSQILIKEKITDTFFCVFRNI